MKWFLGALVVMAAGALFQWGLLVYAMYVLLGVLLASRALTTRWIDGIQMERKVDVESAEIGESAEVRLEVMNRGRFKIPWLLIEDAAPGWALAEMPARIEVEGNRLSLSSVEAGGGFELNYRVRFCKRGYYQLGPTWVETGDLFGLQRRYRVMTSPSYVLVRPQVVEMEGYDLRSRRPMGEVRLAHRLFEDPTRVSGVREYQVGDALNRVHWRATARLGKLHSKTYEPSCVAEAMLVLDFHGASYPDRGRGARVELAVTCAASVANALTQMGQPVGLITNGRDAADRIREEGPVVEFETRAAARAAAVTELQSHRLRPIVIPTQRGEEGYCQILDTLARLELTNGMMFDALVEETRAQIPGNATLIAIVPEVTERMAVLLADLRHRGNSVTVIWVVFDEEEAPEWAARPDWAKWLIGAGVEVRRVEDEAGVSAVCSGRMYR